MAKITQKQLIASLMSLKDIEPRKEWVSLLKSQIINNSGENHIINNPANPARFAAIVNTLLSGSLQRKLAYSFAVILFLVIGAFGFARYTVPGDLLFPVKIIGEQSQAALTGQLGLRQDMAALNNRINDLAEVTKSGRVESISSAINEVKNNASELEKTLKSNSINDPNTIKQIASSLKTLADVPGTDLAASPGVMGLYQTVVESQISDLKNTTLTDNQEVMLKQVEDLYGQGDYSAALEEIWSLTNNQPQSPDTASSPDATDTTTQNNQNK